MNKIAQKDCLNPNNFENNDLLLSGFRVIDGMSEYDQDTSIPITLGPLQLAKLLDISESTALQLIRELPHINLSKDTLSQRPRLRITRETLMQYLQGTIQRSSEMPVMPTPRARGRQR